MNLRLRTRSKFGCYNLKNKRENTASRNGRRKKKLISKQESKICKTNSTKINKNDEYTVIMNEMDVINIHHEDLKPIIVEIESPVLNSTDSDETEMKKISRSIECQTDLLGIEYEYEFRCFSCTLKCEDGFHVAEVQASLLREKKIEKDIEYVDCGSIDIVLPESFSGFLGYKSLNTDEKFEDFCGVTIAVFDFLLSIISEVSCAEMSKENQLLMVLMKLKLALSFTLLSTLFNSNISTTSKIFHIILKLLANRLKRHIFWPSKAVVIEKLPEIFKKNYKNCRVIIDIIEINLEVTKEGTKNILKFPEHEHLNTLKFLIGCTPDGFVSFKSEPFGEKIGDCFIINNSKIFDQLERNDIVLANRTFSHIQKGVERKHAIFVCPPFLIRNPQYLEFSEEQKQETYRIAIYIERIIQKIRIFKISRSLPAELMNSADDILTVICTLNNLCPSPSSLSDDPLIVRF